MRASAVKAEEELQTPKKTSKKKVKVTCGTCHGSGLWEADKLDSDGDWVTVSGLCGDCHSRGYNWKTHH